jgi:hypothetical protein
MANGAQVTDENVQTLKGLLDAQREKESAAAQALRSLLQLPEQAATRNAQADLAEFAKGPEQPPTITRKEQQPRNVGKDISSLLTELVEPVIGPLGTEAVKQTAGGIGRGIAGIGQGIAGGMNLQEQRVAEAERKFGIAGVAGQTSPLVFLKTLIEGATGGGKETKGKEQTAPAAPTSVADTEPETVAQREEETKIRKETAAQIFRQDAQTFGLDAAIRNREQRAALLDFQANQEATAKIQQGEMLLNQLLFGKQDPNFLERFRGGFAEAGTRAAFGTGQAGLIKEAQEVAGQVPLQIGEREKLEIQGATSRAVALINQSMAGKAQGDKKIQAQISEGQNVLAFLERAEELRKTSGPRGPLFKGFGDVFKFAGLNPQASTYDDLIVAGSRVVGRFIGEERFTEADVGDFTKLFPNRRATEGVAATKTAAMRGLVLDKIERLQNTLGRQEAGLPAVPEQLNFETMAEAEAANVPKGTVVFIAGRRAIAE